MSKKKTEIQKLREELESMRDDSENWDEDQIRSFQEGLLPELEKGVSKLEEDSE